MVQFVYVHCSLNNSFPMSTFYIPFSLCVNVFYGWSLFSPSHSLSCHYCNNFKTCSCWVLISCLLVCCLIVDGWIIMPCEWSLIITDSLQHLDISEIMLRCCKNLLLRRWFMDCIVVQTSCQFVVHIIC